MKVIKYFLYLVIFLVLVFAIAAYSAYLAITDPDPLLTEFEKASVEDIRRVKALIVQANTPPIAGDVKTLSLSERDINLGIGYLGPATIPVPKSSYARIKLGDDSALLELTLPVAWLLAKAPIYLDPQWHGLAYKLEELTTGDWLNISWFFIEHEKKLAPAQLTIGNTALSEELTGEITQLITRQIQDHGLGSQLNQVWQNLKQLELEENSLTVSYVLPRADQTALASYQALILSQDEQALISTYSTRLDSLPKNGPLVRILKSLLEYASERSRQSGDPIAENRAALLALAKASGGDQLINMLNSGVMNNAGQINSPYTIYGRRDLAQHLILSAGLTLIADERLAGLIGNDKELADLYSGKSISAWDLLADRAGVRLAQRATVSAVSATTLQDKFTMVAGDSELLPDLGPDFAPEHDRFLPPDLDDLNLLADLSLDELEIFQE